MNPNRASPAVDLLGLFEDLHQAPPAEFQQHYPTTSPAVKPFTAEEAGWFARASKVY